MLTWKPPSKSPARRCRVPLGVGGELQQELLGLGRGEVLAGEREARGETGDERGGGRPEAARGDPVRT